MEEKETESEIKKMEEREENGKMKEREIQKMERWREEADRQ